MFIQTANACFALLCSILRAEDRRPHNRLRYMTRHYPLVDWLASGKIPLQYFSSQSTVVA